MWRLRLCDKGYTRKKCYTCSMLIDVSVETKPFFTLDRSPSLSAPFTLHLPFSQMRSVDRVFKFIDLPSEETLLGRSGGKGGHDLVINNPHVHDYWPNHGQLDVQGLTVKYTEAGRAVLNDISFSVEGGQNVSPEWWLQGGLCFQCGMKVGTVMHISCILSVLKHQNTLWAGMNCYVWMLLNNQYFIFTLNLFHKETVCAVLTNPLTHLCSSVKLLWVLLRCKCIYSVSVRVCV